MHNIALCQSRDKKLFFKVILHFFFFLLTLFHFILTTALGRKEQESLALFSDGDIEAQSL